MIPKKPFKKGFGSSVAPYYAGSAAAPFSLSAVDTGIDNTSQSTYTFSGKNFGTADSTRVLAVALGSRAAAGTRAVASTTIGGVSATKAVGVLNGTNDSAEIWYAAVPTGTSGTVSIVMTGGANDRCAMQLYSIIAPGASPVSCSATTGNSPQSSSAPMTIPAGGSAIGVFMSLGGGPGTPTGSPGGFSNLDLNSNITGTQVIAAMHSAAGAVTGSQTMGFTLASGTTMVSAWAAWGP